MPFGLDYSSSKVIISGDGHEDVLTLSLITPRSASPALMIMARFWEETIRNPNSWKAE
jgi:hypothetical protein